MAVNSTVGWRRTAVRRFRASFGDDLEEPGSKRRARPEARQGEIRLDEGTLRGILRLGRVAGDDVRGPKGEILVLPHKHFVGGAISAAGAFDCSRLVQWRPPTVDCSFLIQPPHNRGSRAPIVGTHCNASASSSSDRRHAQDPRMMNIAGLNWHSCSRPGMNSRAQQRMSLRDKQSHYHQSGSADICRVSPGLQSGAAIRRADSMPLPRSKRLYSRDAIENMESACRSW